MKSMTSSISHLTNRPHLTRALNVIRVPKSLEKMPLFPIVNLAQNLTTCAVLISTKTDFHWLMTGCV